MFLHWPHLPLTENKGNNVALGELPQRLQVLCHKTGQSITHQDLPRMPLHLGSSTNSNVILFSPENSSWNQSKPRLKWCKLRVWACFCPAAAFTAAHICMWTNLCSPIGWLDILLWPWKPFGHIVFVSVTLGYMASAQMVQSSLVPSSSYFRYISCDL